MLEELSGRWAHGRLGAESVTITDKNLRKTHVEVQHKFDNRRKCLGVSSREGWYAAITIRQINNEKERGAKANIPNKNTEFGMCLGFVEWRFESAEFVYRTAQGPNVRFGIVRLFLHQLR